MVCYRVIAAPYVRSVRHVFAYLYTLDHDSELPMDSETSLLLKVFFLHVYETEKVFLVSLLISSEIYIGLCLDKK